MLKKDILSEMWRVHDGIKIHPYRRFFCTEDIGDYKHLLYHLTDVWCDLAYRCVDISEEEKDLYRKFLFWVHDYRAVLRAHIRENFPMEYYDYFDQMVQITHIFLKTGNLDRFYVPCWDYDKEKYVIQKYELVPKERVGNEQSRLPIYYQERDLNMRGTKK